MHVSPQPLCRFCQSPLQEKMADLGLSPLSNSYVAAEQLRAPEPFYPLCAYVCSECLLVQLESFESPDHIFSDYLYFSSYSESWLKHAEQYVLTMQARYQLNQSSLVIEVASNDGYLLQYFNQQGIPVLGVEPAVNVAAAAEAKGVKTLNAFMGCETGQKLRQQGQLADLMVANNVLAHVPDLKDFVTGLSLVLKPAGVLTIEFPHLLKLLEFSQFDTIYHEHFSYFSLMSAQRILSHHGLQVFDVESLSTHGGSLRLHVQHVETGTQPFQGSVTELLELERQAGLDQMSVYTAFQQKIQSIRRQFRQFLDQVNQQGQSIAAYGAPAKGNTFLNYCGLRSEEISFTVDKNPHKQGLYLPGSRIPIRSPEVLEAETPDYVLILPWNLRQEIMAQLEPLLNKGTRFVTVIPELEVF